MSNKFEIKNETQGKKLIQVSALVSKKYGVSGFTPNHAYKIISKKSNWKRNTDIEEAFNSMSINQLADFCVSIMKKEDGE